MLNATDVHQLLDSISHVGCVPSRVDAIGNEVASEQDRMYNQRLVDGEGGSLGSMDSKLLKVLSLSASHTNFALRLVACSARHESAELSVNGVLSLQQVRARDGVLAEHVERGLCWRVISKEVAEAFPSILQLIYWGTEGTCFEDSRPGRRFRLSILLETRKGARQTARSCATFRRNTLHPKPQTLNPKP